MALAKVTAAMGTRAAEALPLALAAALETAKRKRSTGRENRGATAATEAEAEAATVAAAAATAAKIMAVQWKRWIRTGAAWAVQVAGYTHLTGQRRREHRGSDIGKDGGSSTVRFDLAWRRSCLTTEKPPPEPVG